MTGIGNFKLEFTLRQHTPLIHFHDQPGATLRATELKPKLDKFIIQQVFQDEFEKAKTFLVGFKGKSEKDLKEQFKEGYRALNYKVRIISSEVQNKPIKKDDKIPMYFANLAKEYEDQPKFLSFTNQLVKIEILVLNTTLKTYIEAQFPAFIACTNFGSRQNKGYGSFYFDTADPFYQPLYQVLPKERFQFKINPVEAFNWYAAYYKALNKKNHPLEAFDEIGFSNQFVTMRCVEFFYKALRSGVNDGFFNHATGNLDTTFYFKSLIFKYAQNNKVIWEKKAIKNYYAEFPNRDKIPNHRTRDQFSDKVEQQAAKYQNNIQSDKGGENLVRDLFGLSTIEAWKSYNIIFTKTHADKVNGTMKKLDDNAPDKISRFKSPIQFKIIDSKDGTFEVFFWAEPFPKGYLGQTFNIELVEPNQKKGYGYLFLTLPDGFDFSGFFNYFFQKKDVDGSYVFDLENHVETKFQNYFLKGQSLPLPQFNILTTIFTDIRNNLTNAR